MIANLLPKAAMPSAAVLGCLVLTSVASVASSAEDKSILGRWARNDGATQVLISEKGSELVAVNTWVRRPDGPEKVGDTLVLNLSEISDALYKGTAHDMRRDRTYRMTIELDGRSMKTTGCVLMGLVCRTALWTRLD
ncbi:DUF2147 domain-containing protein [Acidisoma sp. 7E03]